MRKPSVVVLDYGSGNLHSAVRALDAAGADVQLTADPRAAAAADGLVVPGVGAFASVMTGLRAVQGDQVIDKRLAGSRPVLGICVGMQVLFQEGVERGITTRGIGELPGAVAALRAPIVPHMGWNTVSAPPDSVLFDGIEQERFYFVHSYAVQTWEHETQAPFKPAKLTWAEHGDRFIAAVENGPLSATQFHPEKSGRAGIQLIRNWLGSL